MPSSSSAPDGRPRALRALRAVTRHIPFRAGSTLLHPVVQVALGGDHSSCWLVSDGVDGYPAMELDIGSPFQRRMFLFPRAYWQRLVEDLPFGRYLTGTLRAGQTFLDVGSNLGFYTLRAAGLVGPEGRVVAFEPEPTTFESVRRSVALLNVSHVECLNLALSDHEGEMPFFVTAGGSAHSLVAERPGREDRYSGQTTVRVTTLDHLVSSGQLRLDRVDLIKIDVEGEEPRTAAGMLQTLQRTGYPTLFVEVRGPKGSTRAPSTFAPVYGHLEQLGYVAYTWLGGDRFRAVTPDDIQGRDDVVFRHPSRPG